MNNPQEHPPPKAEIGDLSTELTYYPVPLIALLGLNALSDEVHATIWNAFTVNRQTDRVPLYFKLLGEGHSFPHPKPKKSSYEWHIPKGILKTRWMDKHLFELPSVALLFLNLDWDDGQWNEKRIDCLSKVDQLRRHLVGRNTRLALVLIQRNAPLPGDDPLATERATLLCNTCDLSANSLFVLPVNDPMHLMGYVLRMETAFYELSKIYYQYQLKTVKSHKDQLNKTTHQLLFVRHQFKMAFYSELKHEQAVAVKHYKQAYANLMEVRATVTNLLEIKTVAGFINYKICRLSFHLNDPLDAISQFRKHVDIFRCKSEPRELEFEHKAWLSKQFSTFGDLFDQAISTGLIPSQTQHPGYYYYEAAVETMARRQLCRALCSDLNPDTAAVEEYDFLLTSSQEMEFFGQRPWRPGCQTLEPLDMEKERVGLKALQRRESFFNHSGKLILLLTCGVTQFKKNKCPRMKRFMMVLMGEEYYKFGDFANSLTFLNQVLPYYRSERWQPIVTSVLTTALKAAFLSANITDFLKLGLEFISAQNLKPDSEKSAIQSSIERVVQRQPPLQLPSGWEIDAQQSHQLWNEAFLVSELNTCTLRMDSVMPLVEIRPRFSSNSYSTDQKVSLSVYLRVNCPDPLKFSKLKVLFTNQFYNKYCEVNVSDASPVSGESSGLTFCSCSDFLFQPMKLYMFTFSFYPQIQDANRDLQITGISLHLGNEVNVVLSWPLSSKLNKELFPIPWYQTKNSNITVDEIAFRQIVIMSLTKILPRKANISTDIIHGSPAFLNEIYWFRVCLQNKESEQISNLKLNVKCKESTSSVLEEDGIDPKHEHSFFFDNKLISANDWIDIVETVDTNQNAEAVIGMETLVVGSEYILFTISYEMESSDSSLTGPCYYSTTEQVLVETVFPISVSFLLFNLLHNPITFTRTLEPFILKIDTKLLSPENIVIVDDTLHLNEGVHLSDSLETVASNGFSEGGDFKEEKSGPGKEYTLFCSTESPKPISLGHYVVKWKRKNVLVGDLPVESKVFLPDVAVNRSIMYVETKFPKLGVTKNPILLTYTIHNRTQDILPIELSMGNSDNFMYSGNKMVKQEIGPQKWAKQRFMLYPLVCGFVALPKLRIVAFPETPQAQPMDDLLLDILPSFMQIMPQEKLPPSELV